MLSFVGLQFLREDREVFQLKQQFLFSVFAEKLQTDKGKHLIAKYFDTSDAQAVFRELIEFHSRSVIGLGQKTDLLRYITTAKLGQGSNWNGNVHSFIVHYLEQIRQYEQIAPTTEHIPESLKMTLLQNAVEPVRELNEVKTTSNLLSTQSGKTIGFNEYQEVLTNAALVFDGRERNTSAKRRQVFTHDINTPIDDILSPPEEEWGDDQQYPSSYDVNQTVLVPSDRWGKLSKAGKDLWRKMNQEDRAVLLGVDKHESKPGISRKLNLTEISAHDYLAMKHDFEQSFNLGTKSEAESEFDPIVEQLVKQQPMDAIKALDDKASKDKGNRAVVPQADLRRMLQSNRTELLKGLQANQHEMTSTPGVINVNGQQYYSAPQGTKKLTFEINMAETFRNLIFVVSAHALAEHILRALIDRGSNGGVAGADMRIIEYHPFQKVDIVGAANHKTTDIRLCTAGGLTQTNIGPTILIFHRYAALGTGRAKRLPNMFKTLLFTAF